jgi:hypothetical protein
MVAPSMVLFEADPASLAAFKFKGDAPRPVDMDRITLGVEPLQGMKIEARNIHFLGSDSDLETIEPCENTFMHFRIDLRTAPLRPQFRKGLAFEGSDHKDNVSK